MHAPHLKLTIEHVEGSNGPWYHLRACDGGRSLQDREQQVSFFINTELTPESAEREARRFAEILTLPFVLETVDRRPPPASPDLPPEMLAICGLARCVDGTWGFPVGREFHFRTGGPGDPGRRLVWDNARPRPVWADLSELNFREAFRVVAPIS